MKILHATAMRHQADYIRASHHVVVPPDVTIEDAQVPGFWRHYAERLKEFDLIDVIGNGFDIQLRVTGKGTGYVETRLLRKWVDDGVVSSEAESTGLEVPEGYVVDHTPRTLYRTRLKDGTELARNMKTKAEAVGVAIEHAKKTGAIAA